MGYPKLPQFSKLAADLQDYALLKAEQRAKGVTRVCRDVEKVMRAAMRDLERMQPDPALTRAEPDRLVAIRQQRPARRQDRLWDRFDAKRYQPKVEGAFLARCIGCTLGAPVEGWRVDVMRSYARVTGGSFPPVDYWPDVPNPDEQRYGGSRFRDYTRDGMDGVPVDDDITYTILGLLVLEAAGPGFTVDDVGRAWVKYLPVACTAEEVALKQLKKGVPAARAAERGNPYVEWIGADIRSDPWAYAAPGWPERAAEMAHRDAWLSHRRNGIYGSMFFAAAQAAAFAVDDPEEALRIGLQQIPARCRLAKDIRWALEVGQDLKNYEDARQAVDERFKGMSPVHTNNNACLTVFGLLIGRTDVTKVLSETVAMGLDNDCTAATAGSIVGAIVGPDGIPPHWTRPFHNKIITYLEGKRRFTISGVINRFARQAARVWKTA